MPDPKPSAPPSPLARALGKIPSGLYILTTQGDGQPLGFVASLVMQTGFAPPTLCVAIGKDRPHLAAIQKNGRFALSILDSASNSLMAPFFKRFPEGTSPFTGLATTLTPAGSIVFTEALGWIDCRLHSLHDTPDHTVVFAEATDGSLLRDADPKIHLRRSGLSY
jgi:flavin reductase (DIM6/NTAB) family NADH-FMN oxidoreductase RutF